MTTMPQETTAKPDKAIETLARKLDANPKLRRALLQAIRAMKQRAAGNPPANLNG